MRNVIKNIIHAEVLNEEKMVNFDQATNNFVVIAGGPGAGKSFITKNLINLDSVKEFNVDQVRVMTAKKLWGSEWQEMISRNMIPIFDNVWIVDNKELIDLSDRPTENIEKIK